MPESRRRSSASGAAGARRESRRHTQNGEGSGGIVQVNTGSLEVYLQGLKKQVIRHEEELQHPSWWEKIKTEVDKVPVMARKLDHSQMDIAALRSFLTESSDRLINSANMDISEMNSKVELVRTDVEGIRALVRRIELHQAVEVSALREVAGMQNALKDIQSSMTEDNSSDRLDALELDVSTLDQNLRAVIDDGIHEVRAVTSQQQQQLTILDSDISKMKEYIHSEVVRVVENNDAIMKKLQEEDHGHDGGSSGGTAGSNSSSGGPNSTTAMRKKAEQNRKVNELIEVAGDGRLERLISFNFGVLKLGNAMKLRRKWEVKICFAVWKKSFGSERVGCGGGIGGGIRIGTPVRGTLASPIIGRNGMQFVDHSFDHDYSHHAPAVRSFGDLILGISSRCYSSFAKHSVMSGFQRWRKHLVNRAKWNKIKNKMTPYLVFWHNKALPDLKRPFWRWRMQTLMKRAGVEIEGEAIGSNGVKPSWRALEFQVIDPDNPSQQVNLMWSRLKKLTHRHPVDKADTITASTMDNAHWVIGHTLAAMARKSVHTDIVAKGCAKDLKRTNEKLEAGLDEFNRKLNSRFDVAEKSLMNYKTSVTMKFNAQADDVATFKADVMVKDKATVDRFEQIEKRLVDMESHSATTDAKLDRVLLLQGNILERIQIIEGRIQAVEDTNRTRDVEVAQALKSSVAAMQDVAHAKAQTKDSLTYFDEELKYLKAYSRRINDDLKQCMTLFTSQAGKSKAVSKELKKRLENITGVLDMHVRGDPLPEELFSLYSAYEQRVVESQSQGRASAAFSPSLAKELANFSHRLAEHVARTVDIEGLYNLVCGPQALPPTSTALVPSSTNNNANTVNLGTGGPRGNGLTSGFAEARTPEEGVLAMREEMFQKFNSEYLTLLNASDHRGQSMGSARAEARIIFHRRFVSAVETALSRHEVLVTEQAKSFFGVKGSSKVHTMATNTSNGTAQQHPQHPNGTTANTAGEENCMACNRPLSTARFTKGGQSSWQQTLLSSQPLAPSLTAVEANTHKFTTSSPPPPRPRQVVEIPSTHSPHRHTAVYSTEAKIAMSHAQADAIAATTAAAIPQQVEGHTGSRSVSPGLEFAVGSDSGDSPVTHGDPSGSGTGTGTDAAVFSDPQIVTTGHTAGTDGVNYYAVTQQTNTCGGSGGGDGNRTVMLQTKTNSIDPVAVQSAQPYTGATGSRPSTAHGNNNSSLRQSQQRPVSASGNSSGASQRHKGAIKDAYVMRGGFKMKIPNKNHPMSGSESVTSLMYSGQGTQSVLSSSVSMPHTGTAADVHS